MTKDSSRKDSSAAVIRISIFVSLFLTFFKAGAALFTNSLAILASSLDSLMDTGSSFVNYIAAREASKPPDKEHEYGHGKIESLAGLFQASIIFVTGIVLIYASVNRIRSGEILQRTGLGITVMGASLFATFALTVFLKKKADASSSLVLKAENAHYFADAFSTAGVIAALFLSKWTKTPLWDFLLSCVIAVVIFLGAYKILMQSIDELLDKSLPLGVKQKIESIILAHDPCIVGIHNFRSHKVGNKIFLDFHIEICGINDFLKAHGMTESLISELRNYYPDADITVHYDPAGEA